MITIKNYLITINHDIQGLCKIILEGSSSINFNSGPVLSFFRDICMVIYEANKTLKRDGVIDSDLLLMDSITEVRHKIKSNQGLKNKDIFLKLLNGHKEIFGDDIDNLGFYIDNEILAGTSLYATFVFADTPLYNQFDKDKIIDFTSIIGGLSQEILLKINQPLFLISNPLLIQNEKEYILKDIWDRRFYTEDITYNVYLTRLLLIQNELNSCVWLNNHLDYKYPGLNLDKYMILRLISTKLFETIRNLFDIKQRLNSHWRNVNQLDNILDNYINIKDEIKTLRDMIHYDNEGINFYDYLQEKMKQDAKYPDEIITIILNHYIYPIRESISNQINIQSYESMGDLEKISRRVASRITNFHRN